MQAEREIPEATSVHHVPSFPAPATAVPVQGSTKRSTVTGQVQDGSWRPIMIAVLAVLCCLIVAVAILLVIVFLRQDDDDSNVVSGEGGDRGVPPAPTVDAVPTTSPIVTMTTSPTAGPTAFPTKSPTTRPTLAPTAAPTARPTPRPTPAAPVPAPAPAAPTDEQCQSELDAANLCTDQAFIARVDQQACFDCANLANQAADDTSCDTYTATMCPNLLACTECGSCLAFVEEWFNCRVGGNTCDIDCLGDGMPEAPVERCTAERDVHIQCITDRIDGVLDRELCYSCVHGALNSASMTSCDGFLSGFCPELQACQQMCVGCLSEIQDWYDCILEDRLPGCDIACEFPPIPPPVPDGRCVEEDAASNCEALSTFERSACFDCVNAAQAGAIQTTCDRFTEEFCPVFLDCAALCGDCFTFLEEWFSCVVGGNSCNVDCLGDGNPLQESTESPTPSPVSTVVSAQACEENNVHLSACLDHLHISYNGRQTCRDCAQQAFDDASFLDGCDGFNADLCPAFLQCEDVCGDCLTYMDTVIDCIFETCPTDCMADGTPGPPQLTCSSEQDAYVECMANQYDGYLDRETCYECVEAVFDSASRASCTSFEADFCPGFVQCSEQCGGCLGLVQDFVDCKVDIPSCNVDCTLPTSTLPPPIETRCLAVRQPLADCRNAELGSTFDTRPCIECVNAANNAASLSSCGAFVSDFCSPFRECADVCKGCLTLEEEWFNCAVGGDSCNIDCLGDGDQIRGRLLEDHSSACDTENNLLRECLVNELDAMSGESCRNCMHAAQGHDSTQSPNSCELVESEMLTEAGSCIECGACQPLVQSVVLCNIDNGIAHCI